MNHTNHNHKDCHNYKDCHNHKDCHNYKDCNDNEKMYDCELDEENETSEDTLGSDNEINNYYTKICMTKFDLLYKMFKSLSSYNDDMDMKFTKTGLYILNANEASGVSVAVSLSTDNFDNYEYHKDIMLNMKLQQLQKILKSLINSELLTIYCKKPKIYDDDDDKYSMVLLTKSKTGNTIKTELGSKELVNDDIDEEDIFIEDTYKDYNISITSKEFKAISERIKASHAKYTKIVFIKGFLTLHMISNTTNSKEEFETKFCDTNDIVECVVSADKLMDVSKIESITNRFSIYIDTDKSNPVIFTSGIGASSKSYMKIALLQAHISTNYT
jgi:hypothetical protein